MVNSTGDPANEYFSDGMSEEFISSLSRLQDLKVIGRTSSFQFKGKTDDSKTIGEKLGVYYLLEGSVRKSADRVRIAVRADQIRRRRQCLVGNLRSGTEGHLRGAIGDCRRGGEGAQGRAARATTGRPRS